MCPTEHELVCTCIYAGTREENRITDIEIEFVVVGARPFLADRSGPNDDDNNMISYWTVSGRRGPGPWRDNNNNGI